MRKSDRYSVHRSWAFILIAGLFACSDGPMDFFNRQMQEYGYIAYQTPLQFAGTGTLVGGRPDALSIIAHPQTCFPSEVGGVRTGLRQRDESTLPTTHETITVEGGASVELFKALRVGSPSISAGTRLKEVSAIELSFNGVHIEYIDAIRLAEFYRQSLSDICKDYLDQVGFIIQAIRVDQMEFKFFKKDEGRIAITADNIEEFVDISADTSWHIERSGSLVINTPKYVGYQLGSLKREDQGLVLQRATTTRFNRFIFEPINIFNKSENVQDPDQRAIPPMAENESGFLFSSSDLPAF